MVGQVPNLSNLLGSLYNCVGDSPGVVIPNQSNQYGWCETTGYTYGGSAIYGKCGTFGP